MKKTLLKTTLTFAASAAVGITTASATYKTEKFPGCDCESPVTLVGFDFQNVATGSMGDSVPASEVFTGFSATEIQGPGKVKIGSINGSNWGCFGGFDDDGGVDRISFGVTNNSGAEFCLNDITFDYVTENRGHYNGPTTFRVEIFSATGGLEWKSFKTDVTPGTTNGGSFSLAETMGYNFSGGDEFTKIGDGEKFYVSVKAWGANSSTIGLDLDNVKVLACPPEAIPEPATSMLAALGASFLFLRRKR